MQKALPHVNLVGNAFWYANEIKGKVAIYTYNWKTGEQKKAASSKIDKKAKGNLMIYVDEDYIYCSELAIPWWKSEKGFERCSSVSRVLVWQ